MQYLEENQDTVDASLDEGFKQEFKKLKTSVELRLAGEREELATDKDAVTIAPIRSVCQKISDHFGFYLGF